MTRAEYYTEAERLMDTAQARAEQLRRRSSGTAARPRVMPAAGFEVTSEPPLSGDIRVWLDRESGRVRVAFRTSGLGLVAELEQHQADEFAAAVLDESILLAYELSADDPLGWW